MTKLFKAAALYVAIFGTLSCNEIEQPQIQQR